MFNLEELAQKWDVQWGFTRPANEQHLSSYKTFLRLSQDWAATITFGVCSLLAAIFWLDALYGLWTMEVLPNPILFLPLVVVGIILIVLAFFADYSTVWLAYRKEFQSESYGSSVWADVAHLKAKKLLAPVGTEPENAVPITRFQRNWWLAFPLHIFAQHVCLIAPPGAGKTSTIVMNVVRWFSGFGGAVILDPKGEIHKHTAHYMSEVMRFDLDKSELTDFFDLFGACRRNPTLAGKIAFTLIHQPEGGGKDPIWEQSATSMLKCLILHLCELIEYPTPQSIFTFLDANPAKAKKRFNPATGKDETYYPLHEAMANSPSQEAKEIWGANFSQLSKDTFTSVIFTVLSRLDVFTDPKVQNALRPPTELELRHGRRKIDFTVLRKMSEKIKGKKRGAGIYCVIPMGEAERLKKVVGCFFAVASNVLRETGGDDQKVYSMLMLDEIGNIPIPGLQELVNLGRGLKICVFMSYQSKFQPELHYGVAAAKAILESVGTSIFLPGIKGDNAEYAVRLLQKTTVYQRSSSDSVKDMFDSSKLTETGRDLMDGTEFRRMKWFTQMIIVNNDCNPIRARFADDAKMTDPEITEPKAVAVVKIDNRPNPQFKSEAALAIPFSDQAAAANDNLVSPAAPRPNHGPSAPATLGTTVTAAAVNPSPANTDLMASATRAYVAHRFLAQMNGDGDGEDGTEELPLETEMAFAAGEVLETPGLSDDDAESLSGDDDAEEENSLYSTPLNEIPVLEAEQPAGDETEEEIDSEDYENDDYDFDDSEENQYTEV